jgi:RNA polymerase sigma factor (sigma-70 family)
MRLAQQGDKHAYGHVYQEISPILRRFVGKSLNRPDDAEDVVQEILISIYRASHTCDTGRPFKTWMFTIARYRLTDHLRTIYAKSEKGTDVSLDDMTYQVTSDENVTKSYEDHEYLSKILQSLPVKANASPYEENDVLVNGYAFLSGDALGLFWTACRHCRKVFRIFIFYRNSFTFWIGRILHLSGLLPFPP